MLWLIKWGRPSFCLAAGCNGWVLLASHCVTFWITMSCFARSSNKTSREDALLRHDLAKDVGAMDECVFFSRAPVETLCVRSVPKPDVWARLLDDFVPAPAQVTAKCLGTTAWWKQGSSFQIANPGPGLNTTALVLALGCFTMAQNLWRSERRNSWSKSAAS